MENSCPTIEQIERMLNADLEKEGLETVEFAQEFRKMTRKKREMLTVAEFKAGMAEVFATVADEEEQKKKIHALLSELEFSEEELKTYSKFLDDRYSRNIIHVDDHYVALLMCWQNSGVKK
jgi:hypothetical protein